MKLIFRLYQERSVIFLMITGARLQGVPSCQAAYAEIPDAALTFYDAFLIEDTLEQKTFLTANGITESADTYLTHLRSLLSKNDFLNQHADVPTCNLSASATPVTVTPNFEKEEYKYTVDRMIQYIIEGDIYIANMTSAFPLPARSPLSICFFLFGIRTRLPSVLILITMISRLSALRRSGFCR